MEVSRETFLKWGAMACVERSRDVVEREGADLPDESLWLDERLRSTVLGRAAHRGDYILHKYPEPDARQWNN